MKTDRTFTVTVTILCAELDTATWLRDEIQSNLESVGGNASVWVGSVQEVSEDIAQLETMLETIKGEPT